MHMEGTSSYIQKISEGQLWTFYYPQEVGGFWYGSPTGCQGPTVLAPRYLAMSASYCLDSLQLA